jgi:hypothetical protein
MPRVGWTGVKKGRRAMILYLSDCTLIRKPSQANILSGVDVRELLLYGSEVESEVTAHDLFHSSFETSWGSRMRQTKRIEGSP